ncbi:MAG: TRAP transporter small permease [Pigmentiphaga sp.]
MSTCMRLYDRFLFLLGMVAGLLIFLVTIGIGIDVLLRAVRGQGLPWLIDLAEYAMLGMTFLGAPWVLRRGGHIAIEIAVMALPARQREFTRRGVCLLGALICAIMAWAGTLATLEAAQRGSLVFKALVFPEWWTLVVIPFSLGLCAFEFLRQGLVPLERAILIPAADDVQT